MTKNLTLQNQLLKEVSNIWPLRLMTGIMDAGDMEEEMAMVADNSVKYRQLKIMSDGK